MKNNEFRIFTISGDDGENKMLYDNLDKFISINSYGLLTSTHHIMQYTGRKDKNNRKIWEGDIVKCVEENYEWDEIDDTDVPKMVENVSFIKYRGHGFWVNSESFGWEGELLWSWDEMEVIGNIHQNKELLKNETKK